MRQGKPEADHERATGRSRRQAADKGDYKTQARNAVRFRRAYRSLLPAFVTISFLSGSAWAGAATATPTGTASADSVKAEKTPSVNPAPSTLLASPGSCSSYVGIDSGCPSESHEACINEIGSTQTNIGVMEKLSTRVPREKLAKLSGLVSGDLVCLNFAAGSGFRKLIDLDKADGPCPSDSVRAEFEQFDTASGTLWTSSWLREAIPVPTSALRDLVKGLAVGDEVCLRVDPDTGNLSDISIRTVQLNVGLASGIVPALVVPAIAWPLFVWLLIAKAGKKFSGLVLGEDNRFSNSKSQMALWFYVLIVGYSATTWIRLAYGGCQFLGRVNISPNLLLLSGASALTFGAAKAITAKKAKDAADAAPAAAAKAVANKVAQVAADTSDQVTRAAAATPQASTIRQATAQVAQAAIDAAKNLPSSRGAGLTIELAGRTGAGVVAGAAAAAAADAARRWPAAANAANQVATALTAPPLLGPELANAAIESNEVPFKTTGKPNLFRDLFCDDKGKLDLGDFQMVIFVLLAVAVYLYQMVCFLSVIELRHTITLPDVDSTILATFGIGQGAYLTKKAVSDVTK